jgi:autotransporter-associated beta strand protein
MHTITDGRKHQIQGHLVQTVLALAVVLLMVSSASADTWTWTGGNTVLGINNWSGTFNWNHTVVTTISPTPVSSPDTVVAFAGSVGLTPVQDIASPFQLNSLNFSNPILFTLTGGTLDFVNSSANVAPMIVQNASALTFLDENLMLGNDTTFSGTGHGQIDVFNPVSGSGKLIVNSSGTLTLSATNTYSGGTTLNSGLLSISNSAALGTGTITLNGGELNAFNNATLTNTLAYPNATPVTISAATGTTLTLTSTADTMLNVSGQLNFGSAGNNGIIVFEPNFLTLSGQTKGNLTVNSGTLTDGDSGLAQMGFTLNELVAAGATLNFNNFSSKVFNLTGAGTVQLGTNGNTTLTLQNASFGGVITGSGQLVANSGPVILSGSNNYTGSTTLGGGTLGAGNDAALSTGPVTVTVSSGLYAAGANHTLANPITINSGLTLTVIDDPNGAHSLTLSGAITGAGSLHKTGSSTLILSGAQGITGGYDVSGGTLDFISAALQPGFLGITAEAGATIGYDQGTSIANSFLLGQGTHVFLANFSAIDVTVANGASVNQTLNATLTNFTNGGNFTSTGPLSWYVGSNAASGVLNINAGAAVSSFTNYGVINIAANATLTDTAANLFLAGGSRTYIGPGGKLTLQGSSTLEVNGALLVNNGVINGTTDVNYGSLAKGAGVYGLVNVNGGGVFAPGNSPGIATAASVVFDNTSVASSGPVLMMELAGTSPGTQYDQLHVTGKLSLGGTLTVSLLSNFTPALGKSFDLLDWGTLVGTFSSVQLPALQGGLIWNTSLLYVNGVLKVTDANHLPGDFNRDGQVTAADIPAMLTALTDLNTYASNNSLSPAQLAAIGDFDGDGQVTNRDIQGLLDLVASLGGGSVAAVPEPSTAIMAALGLVCCLARRKRSR